LGQTKDYEIGVCRFFPAMYATLRSKTI